TAPGGGWGRSARAAARWRCRHSTRRSYAGCWPATARISMRSRRTRLPCLRRAALAGPSILPLPAGLDFIELCLPFLTRGGGVDPARLPPLPARLGGGEGGQPLRAAEGLPARFLGGVAGEPANA